MNAKYAVTISQMKRLSTYELIHILHNMGYISHVEKSSSVIVMEWRDQVPMNRNLLLGMLFSAFKHDRKGVANAINALNRQEVLSGLPTSARGHRSDDFRPIATGKR